MYIFFSFLSLFFQSFAKRKTFARDISSRFPSGLEKRDFPQSRKSVGDRRNFPPRGEQGCFFEIQRADLTRLEAVE